MAMFDTPEIASQKARRGGLAEDLRIAGLSPGRGIVVSAGQAGRALSGPSAQEDRARQIQDIQSQTDEEARKKGIDPGRDPHKYLDLVATNFSNAGLHQEATQTRTYRETFKRYTQRRTGSGELLETETGTGQTRRTSQDQLILAKERARERRQRVVPKPTTQQIKRVTSLINEKLGGWIGGMGTEDQARMAHAVASRANELRVREGLEPDEARDRAFTEMSERVQTREDWGPDNPIFPERETQAPVTVLKGKAREDWIRRMMAKNKVSRQRAIDFGRSRGKL